MRYGDCDDSGFMVLDDAFLRKLERFVETRLTPFTAEDALDSLNRARTEEAVGDVCQYLSRSPIVFLAHYDSKSERAQWLSRAGLFHGKEFAVKVSRMELASGIFIPASRCSIFANPRVAASEFRFYAGRKALPKAVVDVKLDEVLPFYALSGEEFAPQAVAMDSAEDADALSVAECLDDGGALPLKAIDMRGFYWSHQVKPGDYLVFKVANWRNPRFTLSVRRQAEEAEGIEKWRKLFWQFLEKSFEELGPWTSIEDQVAEAFFFGYNSELFALPPDDIINAISLSPDIDFFPFGMETRLWKEGKEYPVHETWEIWLEDVLCGDDTSILESTKFPALPEILFAYIQDSLWRNEDCPAPLLQRLCEANGGKTGKSAKNELAELISHGHAALAETYNIFEDAAASLRSQFLGFYSRIVSLARFCQAAGAQPIKLNEQHILILTQLASHVVECLRIICYAVHGAGAEDMPPAESVGGMEDVLGSLEDALKIAAENYRSSRARKPRI